MSQKLTALAKFLGKESPKQSKGGKKDENPPGKWPSPSAPPDCYGNNTQKYKVRVEGELIVRTNKAFDNLNDCFSVLYYWLDNFSGLLISEFLVTSLFLCLGSNLSPKPDSYGKVLEARLNSVIVYHTTSKEHQACPSWSTSAQFQVNNLSRRTSVSFDIRFFSTRMEGLPIENFFNVNNNPIPDFARSLQTMKVELISGGNPSLVFTGRVLD